MENIVRFAVNDNNNFYKIELSKTLLHFIEFDFTYFGSSASRRDVPQEKPDGCRRISFPTQKP